MPSANERLDDDDIGARREGESTDDYVRRGLRESAGGRRSVAKQESKDRRYVADTGYKGAKYSSDRGLEGTKYSSDASERNSGRSLEGTKYSADRGLEGTRYSSDASERSSKYSADRGLEGTKYSSDSSERSSKYSSDRGLEGTKYSSDRSLEGTRYSVDASERNNKRDAGNTFLSNYATLASQPRNYFAAQELLHNGIGAGYGSFVDDALETARPTRGFVSYGALPGNKAQGMFAQGGDEDDVQSEDPLVAAWKPGDPIPPGYKAESYMAKDQYGIYKSSYLRPITPWDAPKPGMRYDEHPTRPGQTLRRPAMVNPMVDPVTVYDQGGKEERRRFKSYLGDTDQRFGNDVARSALADWQRESGRKRPNLDDPTDRANFAGYVEDWVGVRRARVGEQMASDEAGRQADEPRRRALPAPIFRPQAEAVYVAPSAPHRPVAPARADRRVAPSHDYGSVAPMTDEERRQLSPDNIRGRTDTFRSSSDALINPYEPWQTDGSPIPSDSYAPYGQDGNDEVTDAVGTWGTHVVREGRAGGIDDRLSSAPPGSGGGTNWGAVDTWEEDQKQLARMDEAFKPGVGKWKAGYWEGLDEDSRDLWRSYWSNRGVSAKKAEADYASSRTGNADAFGAGRIA